MAKRFSPEQRRAAVATYDKARAAGMTIREAADACGRSSGTIERWRIEIAEAAPVAVAKKRRCLFCGNLFNSKHAGDRRCGPCRMNGHGDALGAMFH